MKKRMIIAGFLAVFLVVGTSCSSPEKENQNSKAELTTSSKTPAATKENTPTVPKANSGENLFKNNGCVVCHQLNGKLVGPALKDVSSAYKNNKEGLTAFLKGNGKPIVDPAQAAVMQPQIAVTAAMSADDLNKLTDYILSIK